MNNEPNHNSPLNEDAFDREATEGFGLLGSEEEIAALKAETDAAFARQFVHQPKTNKRAWLWSAAAVVVLGLGISVFNVLQPDSKKDMAIAQTAKEATEPAPPEMLSSALDSAEEDKKQASQKPAFNTEVRADAKKAIAPAEPESSFALADASEGPLAQEASPVVAAPAVSVNDYKYIDDQEELAVDKKQEKNLRLREAASEKEEIQKESKKAKAEPVMSKSFSAGQSAASSTDAMAADSSSMVFYPASTKQLRKDAKALLKGIALYYPLEIHLELRNDGSVQSAQVFSKAVLDATVINAAQKALLQLPHFVVPRARSAESPAVFYFKLP